tara:strand:+ start:1107 stop:1349 length:243 start_codon:yes stop_codon:yes gene_type:complete
VQPTVRIHRDGFVFVLADVRAGFGYRLDVRKERGDAHRALKPKQQQQQQQQQQIASFVRRLRARLETNAVSITGRALLCA